MERVYPPKLMFLIVNPIMRWLIGTRIGKRFAELGRLDFKGRRSGNPYSVVVALHDIDGRQAVLTNSSWRHNLAGGHPVELTTGGQTEKRLGVLEADPDAVARVYARRIDEIGADAALRRLGIKVTEGTNPSHKDLAAFATFKGLSVIYLQTAD